MSGVPSTAFPINSSTTVPVNDPMATGGVGSGPSASGDRTDALAHLVCSF